MASSSDHWAQQLKDNIKLIAEIAVPLISMSVAVYLAFRKCKGRNRADPESPNEGPEAIIEMIQVAENESTRENQITSEIATPVICICVAVYIAFRICKGRNRADPKSPNEGPAVTIEMEQVTEQNESAREFRASNGSYNLASECSLCCMPISLC